MKIVLVINNRPFLFQMNSFPFFIVFDFLLLKINCRDYMVTLFSELKVKTRV